MITRACMTRHAWDAGSVGNAVLGGWTVSGIYTARSGRPVTVTQGGLEGATWLPHRVGNPEGAEVVFATHDMSLQKRVRARWPVIRE